jgi:hypothetical protein
LVGLGGAGGINEPLILLRIVGFGRGFSCHGLHHNIGARMDDQFSWAKAWFKACDDLSRAKAVLEHSPKDESSVIVGGIVAVPRDKYLSQLEHAHDLLVSKQFLLDESIEKGRQDSLAGNSLPQR